MKITRLPNGAGSVKLNMDALEDTAKAMATKFVTRVGILGSKNQRLKKLEHETHAQYKKRAKEYIKSRKGDSGEQTNAEIGLLHEKGSISRHIPRRSFLEVPLVQHAKELAGAGKAISTEMKKIIDEGQGARAAWYQAYRNLGIVAERIIQKAFRTKGYGEWPDNSPMTKKLKGSDAPLIDTAQLRRSIISTVVEK